jgi:hypothetical protein
VGNAALVELNFSGERVSNCIVQLQTISFLFGSIAFQRYAQFGLFAVAQFCVVQFCVKQLTLGPP